MPPKTEKAKDIPKETGPKKPIPQQTLAIAGILVLALLGAAVYFVVLPMITGPATTSQNQQAPTGTTSPSSSANPVTPAGASQASTVSLTPGPTQVPPSNRVIVLDAERDPITSIVSVTFRGGEGQYGVSQIMVTLTRSDGSVQVTYNGWPLYTYSKDMAAGDTNGQGFKSLWYAVTPAGTQVSGSMPSSAATMPPVAPTPTY